MNCVYSEENALHFTTIYSRGLGQLVILAIREVALGALVKHCRTLVDRPHLPCIKLESRVSAFRARLIDYRVFGAVSAGERHILIHI